MDNTVYWIWLQQALKPGSSKVKIINHFYKNIKDFYDGKEREWRLCGCFTNKEISALCDSSLEEAEKTFRLSQNLGYKIICICDEEYPNLLRHIDNPPALLYVKGDISFLNSVKSIGIVGTRKASEYGLAMAHDLSHDLALNNVAVISGGALGIDSAAHQGALDAGGKTVAVLGCGINYPYLLGNLKLRNEISNSGAVISEYPPNFPSKPFTFPIRNRIISGISSGIVVIEAGKKSGSLITANLANNQNRDVFVVPVNKESKNSEGSFSLIEDGAMVVASVQDILSEYNNNVNIKKEKSTNLENKPNIQKSKKRNISDVPKEYRNIFEILLKGKTHIDIISEITEIPVDKLLLALTEMEISGFVKSSSGKIYEAL